MVVIIAMNNLISAMLQEIKVYIIHNVTFFPWLVPLSLALQFIKR